MLKLVEGGKGKEEGSSGGEGGWKERREGG